MFGQFRHHPAHAWLNLAALVRLIAVIVGLQLAGVGPAFASIAIAVAGTETSHCACCKGAGDKTAADTDSAVMLEAAGHGDCGDCSTGQPCTDCPSGCASCHHASGARLLLPASSSVIAALDSAFSVLPLAKDRTPQDPSRSSLDRPPKRALAI